jgi:serine phosphatase RsbU (regulator of sigma subunit)
MILAALAAVPSRAAVQTAAAAAPVLNIAGLGKGLAPLAGPWQFHLGDDPAWARPEASDATGVTGWEQLSADKTWGAQGHPAYVGYGWYRKHVHLEAAPGAEPDFALMMPRVDDVYEIYWNGMRIGAHGTMPPRPSFTWNRGPQTFGMGEVRDGVLAVRVWKAPLDSFDSDLLGGLYAPPLVGSPDAIAARMTTRDYAWLRSRQYAFGIDSLYALVALLGLLAWLRNRSLRVSLWIAVFCASPLCALFLTGLRIPFSYNFALGWLQPVFSFADIGLWFLLVYLLELDTSPRLMKFTRALAIISLLASTLDGLLTLADWSNPMFTQWAQMADGVLTVIFTATQLYPLILVGLALRKRLDLVRWPLAIAAVFREMILVARISLNQGSRYTHWTIAQKFTDPLFTINGNVFSPQTIADTLLLLTIIYAAYRFMRDATRRQSTLEQEFRSARELQQVLIPETLPEVPGYAVTSAYRPAQEVGGDFFQIIPLEGDYAGSTLVLLGDVSGNGLKAAMTVSLIVGAVRTLAKFAPQPADLLAELNQRLWGRMQDGFTTCLAMILGPDRHCVVASAGHPAPFLNDHELDLPGALPLGLTPDARYAELAFDLREGDHFSLYTDGLLEARNATGELFSFARVDALFASRPDAARASEAAVDFGQDDDITVLTLTRLGTGERPTTLLSSPAFAAV